MPDDLPAAELPDGGFWAVVHHSRVEQFSMVGFVSSAKIGPFDFLRVDYHGDSVRSRGRLIVDDSPNTAATALFPLNALPVLHVISKEEAAARVSGSRKPPPDVPIKLSEEGAISESLLDSDRPDQT